jgi:hypothetical protein
MKWLIPLIILLFSNINGAIIYLKDGTVLKGKIIKSDFAIVELENEKGIRSIIPREKIERIEEEKSLTYEIDPKLIGMAGNNLKRFTTLYYLGFGIYCGGTALILAPVEKDPEAVVFGWILVVGGAIIQELVSYYFIGKAGRFLEKAVKR